MPGSTGLSSTTSSLNHLTRTTTPHTNAVNTSLFGAMGRGRQNRLTAVEQHNDMTLPTTGATADKSEKVSKRSWGIADALVVSTTVMQLPAMIGQSVVEYYKAEAMAKTQKAQHKENYQLAQDQ